MPNASAKRVRAAGGLRFLTFGVDDRLYALRAEDVAEVIDVPPVARIPQGPRALLGLANLRGSVVPVASLRELLGMEPAAAGADARAIVLNAGSPLALVVEAVDSIVTTPEERVETSPAELGARDGELLSGAFAFGPDNRVAKILDITRMLELAFALRARPQRAVNARAAGAQQAEARADAAQMLVTVEVAGQEFAFQLEHVREILPSPAQVSPLPRAEALILGMTSHRDTLLPLLSLRGLLGLPPAAVRDGREKVVVMRVGGAQVGLVADRARAIVAADRRDVEAVPAILAARTGGEARIAAVYRGDGGRRLISILAHDQLFREDIMQRLILNGGDQAAPAPDGTNAARNEVSWLVFRLADDEFGLPIDAVVEVADVPTQLTRLPKAPDFIEGVINLRGDVLPVVDQRRRFDMPRLDERAKRRLVVVRTERHRAGLIVDRISGVLRISADTIEPAPDLTDDTARLIKGVANLEQSGRMVLLLDPAELLTRAERGLLDTFQAEAAQANA
jgi:purine-binding chemotaxis protein CheW